MHKNHLLFVSGLLTFLAGAGQAAESPFSLDPGVQVAVRVIGQGEGLPPEGSQEEEKPDVTSAPPPPDTQSESQPEVANEPQPPATEGGAQPEGGDEGLVDRVRDILLGEETPEEAPEQETSAEAEPSGEQQADQTQAGETPGQSPETAGDPSGQASGSDTANAPGGKASEQNPERDGTPSTQQGGDDAHAAGGDMPQDDGWLEPEPGLSGQQTTEEKQDEVLARAERVLGNVDQILLDAQSRIRKGRDQEAQGNSGIGDGGETGAQMPYGSDEAADDMDEQDEEYAASEEESGDRGSGQVPGSQQTARQPTSSHRGYEKEDDIVARQVCDLAKREQDPEVRKELIKECEKLRKE